MINKQIISVTIGDIYMKIIMLSTFHDFVSLLQISSDEDQDSDEVIKPTTKKSKKTKKSHRVIESGL